MHAKLYKTDGTITEVTPANGTDFSLEELRGFVGGTIDMVYAPFPHGQVMVVNDNGRLNHLELNQEAMKIWAEWWPKDQYPENNDGIVVGDVLVGEIDLIK